MKLPAPTAPLLAALALAVAPGAAAEWAVPDAGIRYSLKLGEPPEAPECGYFVQLPDGGILGGKPPAASAVAPDGRKLEARLMWHSPQRGFCLVVEDPGAGARSLDVYASGTAKPEYWTPASPLRPGTILCALPGADSIAAARDLSRFSPFPPAMSVDLHAGIPRAAFSIGGDLLHRPPPWVFYMMGNIVAKQAGEFWVAPFTQHGSTVLLVNGKEIQPSNQMPGWGGTGAFVPLAQGLNRVEVFQTASEAKDWLFFFAWAPPYEQFRKPVQNARGAVGADVARSGSAELAAVQSRDGSPVAAGTGQPDLLFWLGDEPPVVVFMLSALTEGNPPDTEYTWTFPGNATAAGPQVPWIFPANEWASATLEAKSAKGSSKSVATFFAQSSLPADLNIPTHNRVFREAVLQMLRSYPARSGEVGKWTDGHWNNLVRTLEFNKSRELLELLFEKHGPAFAGRLQPGQALALQNMLLAELENADPAAAAKWLGYFKGLSKDPAAAQGLALREAELAIYASGDFGKARAILAPLAEQNGAAAARARIRLGDIEFLQGNLNNATAIYSRAQAAAKARRTAPPPPAAAAQGAPGLPKPPPTPRPGFSEKIQQQNEAREAARGLAKAGAIRDVSFSENVGVLLDGNYMPEALQSLEAWELEFPLSKVSGDYILREAQWNAKAGNHRRAVAMLSAYCAQIDASSFVPKAVALLIECSEKAPGSKPKVREVVETVLARMKFHPVAAELGEYLKKP